VGLGGLRFARITEANKADDRLSAGGQSLSAFAIATRRVANMILITSDWVIKDQVPLESGQ